MPPRLGKDPVPRVNQNDGQVRGGGPGGHVPRVLLVTGGVGDDEVTLGSRKIPVGDIDRDLLLPLGFETVRQQREVELRPGADAGRVRLQGMEMILVDGLRVMEEASDQGGLAIVDAPHGREAQQVLGRTLLEELVNAQKYPSRFLISIEPSAS